MKNLDIDTILYNHSSNKEAFKKVYIRFIYFFTHFIKTLISYPGGKLKMEEELNETFYELTQETHYDTYIDGFFGMGGSLKALSESLLSHGVKTVIANDISPCIITLHENVRNSKIEMIDYFLEIIREQIVIPHKKLYVSAEEFYEIRKGLIKRFMELQKNKEFGIETSTLFIMLSASNFSGTVSFKKDGSIYFSNELFRDNSIDEVFMKTIKKIETYNEMYNKFDMKFYNDDYFNLHKKYKDRVNTLWNIDTVYVKEDYRDYDYEEMVNLKNEDIRECKANYGQYDFNHRGVLDSLRDINFIYNNNTHPIMYFYIDKFNLSYKLFQRKESISGSKNEKAKSVTEVILSKNNYKTKVITSPLTKPTNISA